MKPTDEQIEDFAEQFLKPGQVNNDVIKEASIKSAQWAISQMQPEWVASGYGKGGNCPFIDGEYYHCGFENEFSNHDFYYQGIFKFNEGFKDDQGYYLKPFPSHYIHIPQPPKEINQ